MRNTHRETPVDGGRKRAKAQPSARETQLERDKRTGIKIRRCHRMQTGPFSHSTSGLRSARGAARSRPLDSLVQRGPATSGARVSQSEAVPGSTTQPGGLTMGEHYRSAVSARDLRLGAAPSGIGARCSDRVMCHPLPRSVLGPLTSNDRCRGRSHGHRNAPSQYPYHTARRQIRTVGIQAQYCSA
jgi:hypothetical protein